MRNNRAELLIITLALTVLTAALAHAHGKPTGQNQASRLMRTLKALDARLEGIESALFRLNAATAKLEANRVDPVKLTTILVDIKADLEAVRKLVEPAKGTTDTDLELVPVPDSEIPADKVAQ